MNFYTAAIITFFAGISSGLGGLALFFRKRSNKAMSVSLGFASGVMIYLSLTEVLGESRERLIGEYGEHNSAFLSALCFFGGIALISLLDAAVCRISARTAVRRNFDSSVPEPGLQTAMPTASPTATPLDDKICGFMLHGHGESNGFMKAGALTAIAVALHNIPEGIAMFLSALYDPTTAIPLFAAVTLHNIPVGMAVAISVYYSTKNKIKACIYATAAGLVQPAAAILGYLLLLPYLSDTLFGALYALSAGLMIFIALDDLLPSALKYGKHHNATIGVFAGMAAASLTVVITH